MTNILARKPRALTGSLQLASQQDDTRQQMMQVMQTVAAMQSMSLPGFMWCEKGAGKGLGQKPPLEAPPPGPEVGGRPPAVPRALHDEPAPRLALRDVEGSEPPVDRGGGAKSPTQAAKCASVFWSSLQRQIHRSSLLAST